MPRLRALEPDSVFLLPMPPQHGLRAAPASATNQVGDLSYAALRQLYRPREPLVIVDVCRDDRLRPDARLVERVVEVFPHFIAGRVARVFGIEQLRGDRRMVGGDDQRPPAASLPALGDLFQGLLEPLVLMLAGNLAADVAR